MTPTNGPEPQDPDGFRIGIEDLLGLGKDGSSADADHAADEPTRFRIGDLAREFGVTLRTLRFYEDRGLLNPERRGTTRLYSRRDRMRLRLVLICKILGFSLTEAKQIIDVYYQPDGKRKQIAFALERLQEQQKILSAQEKEIRESLSAMDLMLAFVRERADRTDS